MSEPHASLELFYCAVQAPSMGSAAPRICAADCEIGAAERAQVAWLMPRAEPVTKATFPLSAAMEPACFENEWSECKVA